MYIAPTQIFSEFASKYLIQLVDITDLFSNYRTLK